MAVTGFSYSGPFRQTAGTLSVLTLHPASASLRSGRPRRPSSLFTRCHSVRASHILIDAEHLGPYACSRESD